jgi:hypothetical protein
MAREHEGHIPVEITGNSHSVEVAQIIVIGK